MISFKPKIFADNFWTAAGNSTRQIGPGPIGGVFLSLEVELKYQSIEDVWKCITITFQSQNQNEWLSIWLLQKLY